MSIEIPFKNLRKGRRWPSEPLSPSEIRQLLSATGKGKLATRNRAALSLAAFGGLRISEVAALKAASLDIPGQVCRVLLGKGRFGGKCRSVGLCAVACQYLAAWAAYRATKGLPADGPFICTLDGRPVSTDALRKMIGRVGRRAGIGKRTHFHGLRHSYAAIAGRQLHLVELMAGMGFANLAVAGEYLKSLGGGPAIDSQQRVSFDP